MICSTSFTSYARWSGGLNTPMVEGDKGRSSEVGSGSFPAAPAEAALLTAGSVSSMVLMFSIM